MGRRIVRAALFMLFTINLLCLPAAAGGTEDNAPMIALTFDDGPYSPVTNRILDALEAVGGHATFFVEGDRVAGCASVLRRSQALGCQTAIHTWDHTNFLTRRTAGEIQEELEQCAQAVAEITGETPTLVRPIGGVVNDDVCAAIESPIVLWSVDTRDWDTQCADATVSAVLDTVQDGDIVLMHDLYPSTAEAVERLVPELTARGYRLVTVEELAAAKGIELSPHTKYYHFH